MNKVKILLMEEILHHLEFKKPCNNEINYLSTAAGFLPSKSREHLHLHGSPVRLQNSRIEIEGIAVHNHNIQGGPKNQLEVGAQISPLLGVN